MSETVQAEVDGTTEENIFEGYSNRLMSLKEVVERISQLGLAKANGPNRRFMLSHLREGTLKATGFIRSPINLIIEIPHTAWLRYDYFIFDRVTGFGIKFFSLLEDFDSETGDKYKNMIRVCTDYKDLGKNELSEKSKDLEVEINVRQHDWLKFIQLKEIKNNIKRDNQEAEPEDEGKGVGRNRLGKWEEAAKILIKATFKAVSKGKDFSFVKSDILKEYDDQLLKIKEHKDNNPNTEYPQKSSVRDFLSDILKK